MSFKFILWPVSNGLYLYRVVSRRYCRWYGNLFSWLPLKSDYFGNCDQFPTKFLVTGWFQHSTSVVRSDLQWTICDSPLRQSLTDWLASWLAGWLTDWPTDRLTDWLTHSLTHSVTDWLTHWLYGLNDWLTHWLTDWLTDWLTHSLIHWLTDVPNLTVSDFNIPSTVS